MAFLWVFTLRFPDRCCCCGASPVSGWPGYKYRLIRSMFRFASTLQDQACDLSSISF